MCIYCAKIEGMGNQKKIITFDLEKIDHIGRFIKHLREGFNLTPTEMGARINQTGQSVWQYEQGKGITMIKLMIILKALYKDYNIKLVLVPKAEANVEANVE